MALWTTTAANPLDPATPQNIVPVGGSWSALMNTSIDRMHHNLIADNGGAEVAGHTLFTCHIYDPGPTAPATRIFNEVRGYSGTGLPNGGTAADGALVQLFAIGKYNTVTLPGEVFSGTKYQGRAGFPTNAAAIVWFNLNGPGSPNRSVGWHRFDVERMPDGTTINFYVDGIMSRTVTNAVPASWDTVILGPGLGSTVGDAWIDGISVGRVDNTPPVINCPTNLIVVATSSSAGAIVNYPVTATDDQDTSPTITCTPPSGSFLPVGVTQVICTATDDAGNSSRCLFDVTVLPLRFEGFEHWSQGQAVLTPVSNRLVISNLGAGGSDGWRMDLRRVDSSLIQFVPYTNPNNTCTVANVEIELDGRAAQISSQILLGDSTATLRADFAALGSTESEVEVFDGNHRLLDTYRVHNNAVIDVGSLFPAGCDPKTTVYSYFQETNGVCWRLCKVGCVPCNVGTNCYAERIVCLRASAQSGPNIKLHAIEFRAQGANETSSLIVEDVKFMKFGNQHHDEGGLVDATDALLVTDIAPAVRLEIGGFIWFSSRPFDLGVNGINLELGPIDLMAGGIPGGGCITLGAQGMFNGVPAVQLGTAQLRKHATQKGPELSADFRSIGASMVSLEVLSRGQLIGDVTLPNGSLGDVTGSGKLIGVGDAQLSPGTFRFLWDAAMDLRAADGSVFKGDEFRMRAYDPQGQVQTVEMLVLTAENIPEITILDEAIELLGEQFFPSDKIPPPTATWQTLPGETLQYPTPNQGGLALRNLRLSFFDMSFDPPKAGEQATKRFRCILDGEISRGFTWDCIGLFGNSEWLLVGQPPDPAMGQSFSTEMLSLNVAGRGLMLRESPTRPSPGKTNIRPLSTGGDMISSFFDVFTEISLDGGQTWYQADVSGHMELAAYQSIRSTTPNLPPAGGEFDMQCPEVAFANGAVIRSVQLMNLQQGPSMQVPLNQLIQFPVNGAARFEFSRDGQTFQLLSGQVQGLGHAVHSFNYPESGDMSFFDTEMLGLQFTGGPLPVGPPIIVRKNPTALPGAGRSCLGRNELSEYLIASFFDVFTEISLDGGQTFSPAIRPARFTLTNPNGNCLRIQCPPDIRVCACTEQGTPVYYTATAQSSCNTIPTIQCNPPSGTTFPVGSHTVTCVAKDSVGNSASCTFKVEVGLDSGPPRINCPTNGIFVCACNQDGVVVNYPVTATDDCDTNVTIICNPPSGSTLPPGVHTVTCEAIDDCNKRDRCQFVVVVGRDTEPPRIHCPNDIFVPTCNPDGTRVDYVVTATDDCDTNVTITCTPASGSNFPPGTHTVTCTAVDDCGNVSRCEFKVEVCADREPPRLVCPPNIVTNCVCSPNGGPITYTVTATDDCDTNVMIICDPPPGTILPPGVHTVNCRAIDDCNHVSSCEFRVFVRPDTESPTIICPDDMVVRTCRDCAPVNYHVDARDDCDTNVTIVCTPPPGTCFPVGTNDVRCVARDDCGNVSECKFSIIVVREQGPRLTITRVANGVRICWPVSPVGWQLQCARSLNPPILWEPVNAPVQQIGNEFCVTLPIDDRHRFYRLFRPCDQ